MAAVDVSEAAAALRPLASDIGPPLDDQALAASPAALFPAAHQRLLRELNGCTVSRGAYRLLGVRPEPHLDLATWNAPETWRFAWGQLAEPYVFFGGSAWGDQYAYRRLGDGLAPEVYRLEAILLGASVLAGSFEEFLTGEFFRNASEPYEPDTVDALRRWTDGIAADRHWVHSPSLALGGADTLDNVMQLPAATAMTIEGDIATGLYARPEDMPTRVAAYADDRGRSRLRLEYD